MALMTNRPQILVSLDRTWFHRLGASRLTYLAAIRRAGGQPVRLDPGGDRAAEMDRDTIRRLVSSAHGLVLSGGGDVDPKLYGGSRAQALALNPRRDRLEIALIEEALNRRMPVLGICRGSQLLNVAHGGTLTDMRSNRELRRRHARYRKHPVRLDGESRLREIFDTPLLTEVVSYHGQAVKEVAQDLRAIGWAEDGVIEAIECDSPSSWVTGVQWHPELSPRNREQRRLFTALVDAARKYRKAEKAPA